MSPQAAPSADAFLDEAAPQKPSADDFLDGASGPKPLSGTGIMAQMLQPGAYVTDQIMKAFSLKQADPDLGLSKETVDAMKSSGEWNDYAKEHADFHQSLNDGVVQPAAANMPASFIRNTFQALGEAGKQTGEAVTEPYNESNVPFFMRAPDIAVKTLGKVGNIIGGTFGAITSPGQAALTTLAEPLVPTEARWLAGALKEVAPDDPRWNNLNPDSLTPQVIHQLGQAQGGDLLNAVLVGTMRQHVPEFAADAGPWGLHRALTEAQAGKVIGVTEEQALGTQPLTAEQDANAAQAAKSLPEPQTVHEIARAQAPEVFEQYDALDAERQGHREDIARLAEERDRAAGAPFEQDIADLQEKVAAAEARGKETVYSGILEKRIAERDAAVEEARLQDTEEMAAARKAFQEADYKMRDLAPQVSAAYRDAQARIPAAETLPVAAPPEPQAVPVETPQTATPETAAAVSIADQEKQKLIAAGRPEEEASAAAQLVAAHYETLAARTRGEMGTAQELYDKYAPVVRAGKGKVKARELAQNVSVTGAAERAETLVEAPKKLTADRIVEKGYEIGKDTVQYQKEGATKEELFGKAEELKKSYENWVQELTEKITGAKPYDEGVGGDTGVRIKKREGRIDEKIEEKGGNAGAISDYLGGAIEVKSPAVMAQVLERIGMSGKKIIEVEDMLSSDDKYKNDGYRAIHMQVELEPGFSAELQLLPKSVAAIKEKLHPAYVKLRYEDESNPKLEEMREHLVKEYDKAFQKFIGPKPKELFQQDEQPTFYSALHRNVEAISQGKGSAEQWQGIIRNLAQKGVKQEEIDWSGVQDWLKEQKGAVTKQAVTDYLKANELQVQEVMKGDPERYPEESISRRRIKIEETDNQWVAKVFDRNSPDIAEYQVKIGKGTVGNKEEAVLYAQRYFNDQINERNKALGREAEGATKFSKWQTPGGQNYRELLMTLPEKRNADSFFDQQNRMMQDLHEKYGDGWRNKATSDELKAVDDLGRKADRQIENAIHSGPINFTGGHFSEPNVIAHLRFNERTDAEGKKTMFIEEVQSDWHQKGRQQGYATPERQRQALEQRNTELSNRRHDLMEELKIAQERGMTDEVENIQRQITNTETQIRMIHEGGLSRQGVPDAPFKTTWPELAFKRALRYAVENGFDKVAWTTGEQQAARYDLSKHVDSVRVIQSHDGTYTVSATKNGDEVLKEVGLPAAKVADYIGKDLASKAIEEANKKGDAEFSGNGLKVGGEGMKGFYDKILPATVNKLVKKWGTKVGETNIETARDHKADDAALLKELGVEPTGSIGEKVHSVEITPEMRESVMQGQPLFQGARGKIRLATPDAKAIITLMKDANASTFIHETGHQWLDELMTLSKDDRAPDDMLKDASTVRKWLGVQEGEDIPTRAHEKFARGFERYMMEGRAPSKALANVFAKFKDWLTQIYQTVTALKSPISEDIRDVFDRLLTTKPERTIIAPERPEEAIETRPGKMMADIHETDARTTQPEHANTVGDQVAKEVDNTAKLHNPEVADEIKNAEQTGSVATPSPGGAEPSPEPGAGGRTAAKEPEPVAGGGSNVEAKGGTMGGTESPSGATQRFSKPASKLVDLAGNIRLDNLSTPADVSQVIRETAASNDNFMAERRGIISVGQQLDLADALGMDASMLDMRKIGQAFNAEQVIAARKLLIQSATAVRDAMARAATGTDADVVAYAEAKSRHQMIQGQVSGITAEAGRALGAFRKLAGSDETKALGDFLKNAPEAKDLFQLKQEAKFGANLDTPQKVSKFVNDSKNKTFRNMVLEYYINSLLSGPITHLRYAAGNTIKAIWAPLVNVPIAAGIGAAKEAFGIESNSRVYLGEAGAQLYGILKGSQKGVYAAADAFKTGNFPVRPGGEAQLGFLDTANTMNAIPGTFGKIINVPGRSVQAIHAFFYSMRYEQNIHGLAYRAAMKEGLDGDEFINRTADLTTSPTEPMMQQAHGDALKELYMSPSDYHSFAASLQRAINSNMLAKVVIPFMKIGSEITREAFIEGTPLGLVSKNVRGALAAGGATQDMQMAKMAAGIGLMGTTVMMAAEGLCTGDGPDDPAQRRVWLLTHTPNTCQVGSINIPYQGLGSLGMQMRFSANMYETAKHWDSEAGTKLAYSFFKGISKSVLDENFMRGAKDALDAIYHPEEYGSNFIKGFALNWLPFSIGQGQLARQIDPYHRDATGIFEAARARTPFLSEGLFPKRDMFGLPIPNGRPLTDYAHDPVVAAMQRLQIGVGKMENKIRGVQLTEQQYDDYQRIAGNLTKARLDKVVNDKFAKLPAGVQIEVIKQNIDEQREAARNIMMKQNPEIMRQAVAKKRAALQ